MNIITDVIEGITKPIADTLQKYIQSDVDKKQIDIEAKKIALEIYVKTLQKNENFRKFMLEYEGRAADLPKWIQILRALIRPTITIIMFSIFTIFLVKDIIDIYHGGPGLIINKLPSGFWWIFGLIIGFWFGGKAGENIVEKVLKK